jgi:hypothetical protein
VYALQPASAAASEAASTLLAVSAAVAESEACASEPASAAVLGSLLLLQAIAMAAPRTGASRTRRRVDDFMNPPLDER